MQRISSSFGALAVAALLAACASTPPPPPVLSAEANARPAMAWQQGRGQALATSPLAPVAGKNTVTPAAEIPLGDYKLPPGFKAELFATGMPGARAMVMGDGGKIYIGTRGIGRVYELNTANKTNRVVVDKLNQPAGVEYRNGSLYVMAIDKVLRFDGINANPAAAGVDMTAAFKLPKEQHHQWKYLRFGPDGKLYVPFGAPCNICVLPSDEYAQIRRYNPDGSGMEVVATGVRNTVGFDWHPQTKELWFSNHGRDWLGDNTPDDELHRLSKNGANYGFPFCHNGKMQDPDVKRDRPCEGVTQPVTLMGPHVAVMGVEFYRGNMFPAEYKNGAFVARKGSWNRTKKSGYDVVFVQAGADGSNPKIIPFMTGFNDSATDKFSGRPAYFLQLADGSMLISDEQQGAIYRISYSK